jgi:hypothetical protein
VLHQRKRNQIEHISNWPLIHNEGRNASIFAQTAYPFVHKICTYGSTEKRALVEVEKKMATVRELLPEKGREHGWSGAVEPEKRVATMQARESGRRGW